MSRVSSRRLNRLQSVGVLATWVHSGPLTIPRLSGMRNGRLDRRSQKACRLRRAPLAPIASFSLGIPHQSSKVEAHSLIAPAAKQMGAHVGRLIAGVIAGRIPRRWCIPPQASPCCCDWLDDYIVRNMVHVSPAST